MSRKIVINLPVKDVSKSTAFFEALGFARNPQVPGDTAALIDVSQTISLMLLTHPTFSNFSPKPICDTSKAVEALFSLSCESKAEVDDLVAKAGLAGGTIHEKGVDYGFMYHGSFADLDGHLWALNHMSGTPPQG